MATQRRVRIDQNGRIVEQDRQIHVNQEDAAGNPDTVRFRHVGTGPPTGGYTIDFGRYLKKSPFGNNDDDVTFNVPPGGKTKTVDQTKTPGVYKYDVVKPASGSTPAVVTDDPDVIVD